MTIDEIIYRFRNDLISYFGKDDGLLKITLTHELFDQVMLDLFRKEQGYPNKFSYSPSAMNDFVIYGVRLEARAKERTGGG